MLPAQPDEMAWRCAQCGAAWALDETDAQTFLQPVAMHFSARLNPQTPGRPFWVAEGRVSVQRETYGGDQAREAQAFWSQPRRFFVPAFVCGLDEMIQLGRKLLLQPPEMVEGPPAPHHPITVSAYDVRSLAEFIVVGLEAERRDQLRRLEFNVQLQRPELWIFP